MATEETLAEHIYEALASRPGGTVRLRPAFEQWVVPARRGHDAFVAPEYRARVYRPQAWLSPVLVVDGRMEGTWSTVGSSERLRANIEPFADLPTAARRWAEAEAERLATFLRQEAPADLEEKEAV